MALRVMTMNIHGYGDRPGPWEARLPLLRDTLAAADADVIALQAVAVDPERDRGRNQAQTLAESLEGYSQVHFERVEEQGGRRQGMALLSRLPVRAVQRVDLSRREGHEDASRRALLHAVVETSGGPLHLMDAHFSWVPEQCRDNAGEAIAKIQPLGDPVVLLGDLNAEPDSEAMSLLREAGLVDLWARLRPDDDGYTFEARNPEKRIDYVWATAELAELAREARIVGAKADDGTTGSDHLGLVVSFER